MTVLQIQMTELTMVKLTLKKARQMITWKSATELAAKNDNQHSIMLATTTRLSMQINHQLKLQWSS
jgi:hypothetical protein